MEVVKENNNVIPLKQSKTGSDFNDEQQNQSGSSVDLYASIINTLPDHIAVIDAEGNIQHVNTKWEAFGSKNGFNSFNGFDGDDGWEGINYLKICKESALRGDPYALDAYEGIKKVIDGEEEVFQLEYPCHSPIEERWFVMRVTAFNADDTQLIVISHQNISKIALQAMTDGLLNIANRRHFEEFYDKEWKRCTRHGHDLSMALIDLDQFKNINDTYGHEVGDYCLVETAKILKQYTRRVGDLCARYGGDEMVIVWSETSIHDAKNMVNKILHAIRHINIGKISAKHYLTASIGLASITPLKALDKKEFWQLVDHHLYQAKKAGRNQVFSG